MIYKNNSPDKPDPNEVRIFQAAIGGLLYLMVCTRPDLSYSVCNVARFMHSPGKTHWEALKRIFKY